MVLNHNIHSVHWKSYKLRFLLYQLRGYFIHHKKKLRHLILPTIISFSLYGITYTHLLQISTHGRRISIGVYF